MDEPDTSMRSGPEATRARSNRASAKGSVLDIGGVPLLLRATDGARAAVLDTLFGSLEPCPDEPVGEIVVRKRGVARPSREPDEVYTDLRVWRDGEVLSLASGPHAMTARATPTHAELGGEGADHSFGVRRFLQPVFTHMLGWHGSYILHGAAVRRGDRAALVVANSGQGKSTLALAALEHGWEVLSDDLVAVRIEDGTVVVQGVPKPLALPADVEADVLADATVLHWDKRQRRQLPSTRLDHRPAPLGVVLVVGHGQGAGAAAEPIAGSEVTTLLFQAFMSTPDPPLLRRYFPVGAAIARTPMWRFLHSADPSRRLSEAARLLDELTQGW
jgi:hypothetical protein